MSILNWLLLGAGTWLLAGVLKVGADLYVQRRRLPDLRDWAAASLSGLWSATCELGLFALAIWFWSASLTAALAAAFGAALAELLALLPAILSTQFGKASGAARQKSTWKAIATERGLHMANHVLVRMLLWTGLMAGAGAQALAAAFGIFALVEAAQAFAQARNWDLLQPRLQALYLSLLGTVTLAQAVLLALWW